MVYTSYVSRLFLIFCSLMVTIGLISAISTSNFLLFISHFIFALLTITTFLLKVEIAFIDGDQLCYTVRIWKLVNYKKQFQPSQIKHIDFKAPLLNMRQIIITLENKKRLYIWNTEPVQFYNDIDQYCMAHHISINKTNEYIVLK